MKNLIRRDNGRPEARACKPNDTEDAMANNIFDLWGNINSVERAINTSRSGMIAAFVFTAITSVALLEKQFGALPPPGFGASTLADAAVFAILGWGIQQRSRICAVLAPAYYLYNQLVNMESARAYSAVMLIIFLVMFLKGIRGTFAYHRLKAASLQEGGA